MKLFCRLFGHKLKKQGLTISIDSGVLKGSNLSIHKCSRCGETVTEWVLRTNCPDYLDLRFQDEHSGKFAPSKVRAMNSDFEINPDKDTVHEEKKPYSKDVQDTPISDTK